MAKKQDTKQAPQPDHRQATAEQVTVCVGKQALYESGRRYAPGETFTTTTDRAQSLGHLIERR